MHIAAIIAAGFRASAAAAGLGLGVVALAAPPAPPGPVGQVVQALGTAQLAGQPARVGQAVLQGQVLSTGPDGFLYVHTPDHGLLVLRPNSALRIEHYYIDPLHPEQSRFRLQHLRGTVRSVSGQAVPAARQQFRFNTPVAAIGLVGTDFTVFTTDAISRVSVASGAVQVSGFGNGCLPDAFGPCAGAHVGVLQATPPGLVLQVQRGQLQPQLLHAPLDPGAPPTTPPATTPPEANPGGPTALQRPAPQIGLAKPPAAAASAAPAPLLWGRWQALAAHAQPSAGEHASAAGLDLAQATQAGYQLLALSPHHALLRHPAHGWVPRSHGVLHFGLHRYQAHVEHSAGQLSAASVSHASLQFDFTQQRFTTRLQIQANGLPATTLQGSGSVAPSGQFDASPRFYDGSTLSLSGALAQPPGAPAQAAYLFSAPLPGGLRASGATFWLTLP